MTAPTAMNRRGQRSTMSTGRINHSSSFKLLGPLPVRSVYQQAPLRHDLRWDFSCVRHILPGVRDATVTCTEVKRAGRVTHRPPCLDANPCDAKVTYGWSASVMPCGRDATVTYPW